MAMGPASADAPADGVLSLLDPILRLHHRMRAAVLDACTRADTVALSAVAGDGDGDALYRIDRVSEDVLGAGQTEIPLVKQYLSDQVWAVRGGGVRARRYDRLADEHRPLQLRPSSARSLDVAWVGYASAGLGSRVEPALRRALAGHGLVGSGSARTPAKGVA